MRAPGAPAAMAAVGALVALGVVGAGGARRRADLDHRLVAAATAGYSATVRRLLDAGANPDARDAKGQTALLCASRAPVTMSMTGMRANGRGCQVVVKHKGYRASVAALLDHGARVDVVDADGWGPLARAAEEDAGDLWRRIKALGATR